MLAEIEKAIHWSQYIASFKYYMDIFIHSMASFQITEPWMKNPLVHAEGKAGLYWSVGYRIKFHFLIQVVYYTVKAVLKVRRVSK